jgi:hypothetical protein
VNLSQVLARVLVLGISLFSVYKGKFGEVKILTVVAVKMVVGVGWRCTLGGWKGS